MATVGAMAAYAAPVEPIFPNPLMAGKSKSTGLAPSIFDPGYRPPTDKVTISEEAILLASGHARPMAASLSSGAMPPPAPEPIFAPPPPGAGLSIFA